MSDRRPGKKGGEGAVVDLVTGLKSRREGRPAVTPTAGADTIMERTQEGKELGEGWWEPSFDLECSAIAQSCLPLFDPMGQSLPGSSVHGILQARILEWVTISSSRGTGEEPS